MRWMILLAATLALVPSPAPGMSVKVHNLEELMAAADRVFVGRVVSVTREADPTLRRPVWVTRFDVVRPVKGTLGGEVVIRQLASPVSGLYGLVTGMPSFSRGGEFLVFLYGDSILGLTSPVGIYQGRMPVIRERDGRRTVLGAFHDNILLRGLRTPGLRSRLLDSRDRSGQKARRAQSADYDSLMEILDQMAR